MKSAGISAIIAFPLTVIIHYFIFSKIEMHPTLHALIGAFLLFIILGITMLILEKKSKKY